MRLKENQISYQNRKNLRGKRLITLKIDQVLHIKIKKDRRRRILETI